MYSDDSDDDTNTKALSYKRHPSFKGYGALKDDDDDDKYINQIEAGEVYETLDVEYEESKYFKFLPLWYKKELRIFFSLAWPLILTALCQFLLPPISLVFCGRLGTTNLAGAALANTVLNVTGIAVGTGLAFACDTLFSQTFGSDNKKKVGLYVQRGLFILTLGAFPCWTLHLNALPLLLLMGQNPEVSQIASEYILYFMPGLVANFWFQVLAKYIQNQNIVFPPVVVGILGNLVNVALHAVFLIGMETGTNGSAVAQAISFWFMFLCMFAYIKFSKVYKDTWDGWTWEAFQEWGLFIKLAIPGMLMVVLEWFSFEVATILTGLLGEIQLSAQSIMFQLEGMAFMPPLGVSIAANIRVGQCLGASNVDGAKKASKTAYTIIAALSTIIAILIAALSGILPKVFSDDPLVISYAAALIPMLSLFHILDGVAATSAGILRGCGRQGICACVIFVGYYILSLPIGIPLMFLTKLEVSGYWWGLILGLTIEAITFLCLVVRTNWDRQVELALVRAGVSDPAEVNMVKVKEKNTDPGVISETEFETDVPSDYSNYDENTGLLKGPDKEKRRLRKNSSLKRQSFNRTFSHDEVQRPPMRRYSSAYLSEPDLTLTLSSERLEPRELIFRRSFTIIGILLLFVIGIFTHFNIVIPPPGANNQTETCTPYSESILVDGKIPVDLYPPVCNNTLPTQFTMIDIGTPQKRDVGSSIPNSVPTKSSPVSGEPATKPTPSTRLSTSTIPAAG